jgi:DNA-binding NtrC family response regulator
MSSILILDQDKNEHCILSSLLTSHRILSAYSAKQALDILKKEHPDLILMDIKLPDADGFELIEILGADRSAPPVIVLSAYSSIPSVVRAIRGGAVNYLEKPCRLGALRRAISEALTRSITEQEVQQLPAEGPLSAIVGSSSSAVELRRTIALYAETHMPVLITGESGSGKELVARSLHLLSKRRDGPYQTVHCGAIPPSLMEVEIYGSEPGAFTEARTRAGFFEKAHRGSLFLDEIGEMPPEGQVKLLRILEETAIQRIGGNRKIPIDVRVISATNRNLKQRVKEDYFREDLLFRINTLLIEVPPLRERIDDIPALSRHLLGKRKEVPEPVSREALMKLMAHSWPGNVRELRNVLHRARVNARGGHIEARHIHFDTL